MDHASHKIAVVIPCYKVREHIAKVVKEIPALVSSIYCVDDACPENSGAYISENLNDPRLKLLSHKKNQGVGGAVMTGYKQALEDGADIIVKVDGDGQMDPALIERFVRPIVAGQCDYTKGNRFYRIEDVRSMPGVRLFGNAVLSFMTKLSSGYWTLFDPTNGYTAIHARVLGDLPLDKISKRYFFESDMLFRLNTVRAVVWDIPMSAVYADEESNLNIRKIIWPFLKGHARNFGKRVFYNYFLRDFNIASVGVLLGLPLLLFGVLFGLVQWSASIASGHAASAGTVMLCALPIIVGMQLLLSFVNYDIQSVPDKPRQML